MEDDTELSAETALSEHPMSPQNFRIFTLSCNRDNQPDPRDRSRRTQNV